MNENTATSDENLWDDPIAPTKPQKKRPPRAITRFIHVLTDLTVAVILYYIFIFILIYLYGDRNVFPAWLSELNNIAVIPLSFYIAYCFFMEALAGGQTIGKLITRHRVENQDGSKPRLGAIFIRTLVRLIPFEAVTILIFRDRSALHDRLSGTRVVELSPLDSPGEYDVIFDHKS